MPEPEGKLAEITLGLDDLPLPYTREVSALVTPPLPLPGILPVTCPAWRFIPLARRAQALAASDARGLLRVCRPVAMLLPRRLFVVGAIQRTVIPRACRRHHAALGQPRVAGDGKATFQLPAGWRTLFCTALYCCTTLCVVLQWDCTSCLYSTGAPRSVSSGALVFLIAIPLLL